MQLKKQQLELDMEQLTGLKLGKAYNKAVCWHPAYLTYMQRSFLMRVKEESGKAGLKLNIQKIKVSASSPIISWQIKGKSGNSDRFFSWAPKLLQTVTGAMKLKDTCSLEGML